jgi:hypothetical protein
MLFRLLLCLYAANTMLQWYIREASTAIYVANIPTCWPLARRLFGLKSWGSSDETRSQTRTKPKSKTYMSAMRMEGTNASRFPPRKDDKVRRTESMQNIIEPSIEGRSEEAVGYVFHLSRCSLTAGEASTGLLITTEWRLT